jgi:hypothetical protein
MLTHGLPDGLLKSARRVRFQPVWCIRVLRCTPPRARMQLLLGPGHGDSQHELQEKNKVCAHTHARISVHVLHHEILSVGVERTKTAAAPKWKNQPWRSRVIQTTWPQRGRSSHKLPRNFHRRRRT